MKLLSLTLKNLNSLKGQWQIDFTHSAYQDSGIFAITGQTGAGKTTILDAICLALYGKTPRVEISKTSNEVMTRGAYDCLAEVEIEIKGVLYQVSWTQRRARKKADGNLQDVQHTLSRLERLHDDQGKIIESKASLTKKQIIELIGMDFEQFTRSVLLAQGQFAKFLTAKRDDRANILEKITGTDIYATISRRVHEKKRSNEQALKELMATLEGMELLSSEEVKRIEEALTSKQSEHKQQQNQLININEKINQQNNFIQLTHDYQQQAINFANAQQALKEFANDESKLKKANKALEINADYQQLTQLEKQSEDYQQQLAETEKKITQTNHQLATTNQHYQLANHEFHLSLEKQKQQLEIIKKVRVLDNEIGNKKQLLDKDIEQQNNIQWQIDSHQQQANNIKQQLDNEESLFNQLNDYLLQNSHYQHLLVDIHQLSSGRHTIEKLLLENIEQQNRFNDNFEQQKQLNHQQQSLTAEGLELKERQAQNKNKIDTITNNINTLLKDKSIKQWQADENDCKDKHNKLAIFEQHYQQLVQTFHDQKGSQQALDQLVDTEEKYVTEIDQQTGKISELKGHVADKEQAISLQEKVIKLEHYIETLQDDEACPLCGATTHPYLTDLQQGSHPDFNPQNNQQQLLAELQQQADELHNHIKQAETQLQAVQQQLAINQNQQQNITKTQGEQAEKLQLILANMQQNEVVLFGLDNEINIADIDINHIEQAFLQAQETNQKNLHHCQQVIGQYEEYEQDLSTIKAQFDRVEKDIEDKRNQYKALLSENNFLQEQNEFIEKNIDTNFKELAEVLDKLTIIFNNHQLSLPIQLTKTQLTDMTENRTILGKEVIHNINQQFSHIEENWQAKQSEFTKKTEQKQTLEKSISNAQIQLTQLEKQQSLYQQDCAKLRQKIESQQVDYQHKLAERQALFLDKNPDDEERYWQQTVAEKQNHLQTLKDNLQALQYSLDNLTLALDKLKENIANNSTELTEQLASFHNQLQSQGFSDREDFENAQLTQQEREQLTEKYNLLTANMQQAELLLNNTKSALDKLKGLKDLEMQELDLQELLTQQQEKETVINKLAQEIGANQQKLTDNQAKQARFSDQQQAIDKQRQANQLIEQLHSLIGSSDGQKFRNFAQGLTFDFMIQGANQQLKKMNDRYLLIRDEVEPLELNVVDNYQAGEIRSCKNLSGGESFIISLALALGLSQMASHHDNKNIHVDSLFLDEGFGTLDEDSLDIALDTLSNLQQAGKLIGVISHVQSLKDRIPTQIKVEKISGGVSRLSGAGVKG